MLLGFLRVVCRCLLVDYQHCLDKATQEIMAVAEVPSRSQNCSIV